MNKTKQPKEYYLDYYGKSPVTIIHEFTYNGHKKAVVDNGENHLVTWKKDLLPWENTSLYVSEKRAKDKLDKLTQDYEELLKTMQDKAVKSLSSRIRINVVFGNTAGAEGALVIVKELEKLIYEQKAVDL